MFTYQTRIQVDAETDQWLLLYAELLSKVVRSLFAQSMAGKSPLSLKNAFLKRFGMTARQFNGCRVQMEGKIESARQINEQRIQDLKAQIQRLKKKWLIRHRKESETKIWHQKRRLSRLQVKLAQLESDKASGRVRICFGSRKLFRSQFSGQCSHEEWKKQWERQRSREFFALGSKDETSGNQTCTATIADDGSLTLRLRLPNDLNRGKYLQLHNVRFAYGQEAICAALCKKEGQAISYRFLRDEKGWRIFASTTLPEPTCVTKPSLGVVGIDINNDHLAVVETDRNGNPLWSERISLQLYGKNKNQTKAIIGEGCKRAVEIAAAAKKPLVIEQLDFTKKKGHLKELRPNYARLLSSFAYRSIIQGLRSRAFRRGVQLFSVNPAFTSLIGQIKFAARYGLTTHQAAALCIARRFQGFSESLPSESLVPNHRGNYIAFSLPVRNRKKDEWFHLRNVKRKLQAAFAEHFRVARCQSTDPPKADVYDKNPRKLWVRFLYANR